MLQTICKSSKSIISIPYCQNCPVKIQANMTAFTQQELEDVLRLIDFWEQSKGRSNPVSNCSVCRNIN